MARPARCREGDEGENVTSKTTLLAPVLLRTATVIGAASLLAAEKTNPEQDEPLPRAPLIGDSNKPAKEQKAALARFIKTRKVCGKEEKP